MKPVCRMFRSIEVSVIGALLKKPLAAACSSSVLIFPTSGVSQNRSSSAARVLSVLRFRRLHTHRRRPAEESVSGRRSTMSGESWRSIFFMVGGKKVYVFFNSSTNGEIADSLEAFNCNPS